MMQSMRLDFVDFKNLLHDFEDLVSDKHYDKMDYRMWRKVSSTMRPDDTIVFFEWTNNYAVDIAFGEETEWHRFVFGDNSFGDFLWENLLKDYEYWNDPWGDPEWHTNDDYKRKEFNEPSCKIYLPHEKDVFGESVPSTGHQAISTGEYLNSGKLHFDMDSALGMPNLGTFKADVASSESTTGTLATLGYNRDGVSFAIDTKVDKTEFESKIDALTAKIQAVADKYNNKNEENVSMNGFKFDFGPANHNTVRMSMYGLAVKNKTGTWVSYDAKTGEIMDVDIFNFEGAQFIWRMPVAIKDIAIGDVVVHQGVPMFVVAIPDGGKVLTAVDPVAGERKDIMLARSPFGFNFATKVVNFLDGMFGGAANADNPFGNMWMLMAMQGENGFDANMLMPMMFMNQGNMDPTMMMVFMAMGQNSNTNGKMDMNAILPLMWAAQNMNKPAQHVCNCGQHNQ